ncbi:MAG: CRISPR-associated endonuclease Cas6, partial [Candidatus Neomarinimicrobiota bacterium]|nr:CRISPR-associated endonuclease Cas6 [Candidatus Neomarinimicrobiota bacterium]
NITFEIKNTDIEQDEQQFIPTDRLIRYRFITPWVALNQMTGGKYRFLTNQEKPSFLNRLLGQNIVFMAKEVGIDLNDRVFTKVKVSSLFPKPVDENKWGAFMGEFKTNFVLPNYIGVGNGITRGYGTIYGMFNPETFSFDEDKLAKEKSETPTETFTEDDDQIDSVEAHEVPKPKRRQRKPRPKKTSRRKRKSSHQHNSQARGIRTGGRIFSEEFDIEDDKLQKGNMIADDEIEESPDDSKFNTEKHHKRQHKF